MPRTTGCRLNSTEHLQAAARTELSKRGFGAEDDSLIDPFALLTTEQIQELLADFETKDEKPKGHA